VVLQDLQNTKVRPVEFDLHGSPSNTRIMK
jgi:hypothetical protein